MIHPKIERIDAITIFIKDIKNTNRQKIKEFSKYFPWLSLFIMLQKYDILNLRHVYHFYSRSLLSKGQLLQL